MVSSDTETSKSKVKASKTSKAMKSAQTLEMEATDITPADETEAISENVDASSANEDKKSENEAQGEEKTQSDDDKNAPRKPFLSTAFIAVTSAMIGGFVAIALHFALDRAEILPLSATSKIHQAQKSISLLREDFLALRNNVQSIPQSPPTSEIQKSTDLIVLNEQMQAFESRLENLESFEARIADNTSSFDPASFEKIPLIAALNKRIEKLETTLDQSKQSFSQGASKIASATAPQAELSALSTSIDQIEAQIKSLQERVDFEKEKALYAEITRRFMQALKRAKPLEQPLRLYQKIDPDFEISPRLQEAAKRVIPLQKDLLQDFQLLKPSLKVKEPPVSTSGNDLLSQLTSRAQSLISIEKKQESLQQDQQPQSPLDAFHHTLRYGNVAQALTQWKKLPTQIQEKAVSFAQNLELRVSLEEIYNRLDTRLLERLSASQP